MSERELTNVVERFRDALRMYVRGDPEAAASFFSTRNDVTLANPLGPPRLGPAAVRDGTIQGGASFKQGGELRFEEVSSAFEEVSRYVSSDLGYVVQIERHEGRVVGRDDPVVIALRVTLIFRLEDGVWKIAHRHADPITTPRPISTTVQSG